MPRFIFVKHAAMHTQTLFSLRQLSLSFRARPVLKGIDWTWNTGDHWAIVGPNGAGKSALAGVLSGENRHYAGDYARSEELNAAGVAYVGFEQARQLCERDRKLDCAEYASDAQDRGTSVGDLLRGDDTQPERRAALVELLRIGHILDRGLRYVSTGEMRKALLASALLRNPGLLILDGPMDGLDADTQQTLGQALDRIIVASPAVLVLCRSADEVPAACNKVMLIENGRIVEAGERQAVLAGTGVKRLLTPEPLEFTSPPAQITTRESSPSEATLQLDQVSVNFGDLCVFRDLSWTLKQNQHCMICGPNGSGKSTLLDLLTGDNHKAYGQAISFLGKRRGQGESVWDIKALFGRVDARMQFAVPNGSSVIDVVLSGFYDSTGLRDRTTDRQRAAARDWLHALGLGKDMPAEFHTLSFGLQRLVLLARAMVKGPAILLLDEATLSLDAGHRRLLLSAVDHIIDAGGCQLLFVSHSSGERPACINQLLEFTPGPDGSVVSVRNL